MKGQFCRIFLILSLAILVVCLPAQAAHAGQAGSSSPMSDHGAQVNVSSGLSAGTSPESVGKASGIDTGSSVSSQSLVQTGPEVTASGKAQDSPGTTDKSTQSGPVNTKTGSSPSAGLSGDNAGRSDLGNNGRAEAAGDMGSPQGTGGENAAGIPDAQGQSKESGRLAGMMVSPVVQLSPDPHPGARPAIPLYRVPVMDRHRSGSNTGLPHNPEVIPAVRHRQARSLRHQARPGTSPKKRLPRGKSPNGSGSCPGYWTPSSPILHLPLSLCNRSSPFNMLLLGGFRRISKKNVLEHDARQVIYQAITATPGIDVKTLTDMTGINENTLRYHVDRLVATGKISCFTRPGVVRYFQNQGAYSQFEHMVFHYLWTDTPRGILWLLYQHPGLTRQHLADALAISGPSVTRQMDNLIEDGVVENRFPGRSNHYYLTAEAALTIDKVMSQAPVMIHSGIEARPLSATAG